MSDQHDSTERELDQAVETILGPPENSDSDLLRPIKRENIRTYLGGQSRLLATANRSMKRARMRERLEELEHGIAHLPLRHPHREKPEARIAELKAQLAELNVEPIDSAGISISTSTYRPAHQDLSTTEEPAEVDGHSQSTHLLENLTTQGSAEGHRSSGLAEEAGKRRGRRRNQKRRDAIHNALTKHGDEWRDHLSDIFKELDSKKVSLGDLQGKEIDLGDGKNAKVWKWDDLDLALGEERKQILDTLRKYVD